jgi:uncharacterized protein YndB with AHSA1/START domain
MAENETYINASPARIFELLGDPDCYPKWVVGTRAIRDADEHFPAPGSRFHHQIGVPPLVLNDHTEVLEHDPPSRIVLQAKTRPFGTARIELRLAAEGAGTRVTLIEQAGDLPSRIVLNPLSDPLVHARNSVSLGRLRRLAERRR